MRNLKRNEVKPDNEVWFADGFLYIISGKNRLKAPSLEDVEWSVDVICLHPEFDSPMNLVDIKNAYPDVVKVIHEDFLHGEVYTYGNHKHEKNNDEAWELTGETLGFA